jgi:methionyl-tRNA formyltransferase
MLIVFMGSPAFAVPALQALAQRYSLAGVVTQPDSPSGRGRSLTAPPVKVAALELGLPVFQPDRLRDPGSLAQLRAWEPDLIVVAAYGQILRQPVLDLPSRGCLNVHASLLPRWRGAAPIQAAIAAGDTHTGVSIMVMDTGVDTGPTLAQRRTPIPPDSTGGRLSDQLAAIGAELLVETLPGYLDRSIRPNPQPAEGVTYAPPLKKDDGRIDPGKPAGCLALQVRAYEPRPGSFLTWGTLRIVVRAAHEIAGPDASLGTIAQLGGLPAVRCADGWLALARVQPAGKRSMDGDEFARGTPDFIGSRIPS